MCLSEYPMTSVSKKMVHWSPSSPVLFLSSAPPHPKPLYHSLSCVTGLSLCFLQFPFCLITCSYMCSATRILFVSEDPSPGPQRYYPSDELCCSQCGPQSGQLPESCGPVGRTRCSHNSASRPKGITALSSRGASGDQMERVLGFCPSSVC